MNEFHGKVRKQRAKFNKISTKLREEMNFALYDQLVQYTSHELQTDVRTAGHAQAFESLRRAMVQGKKKTNTSDGEARPVR